ncbi:CLUMA_CG002670, isoform A [Clunio marinus]|uniref:CLUMA_CG002670, isoform A n=1 Tax=Clunio marinus TaxID=568069 RepID=A0A1J1HLW3_9DIPT|nr:CLUMA_CG002670, isoform A [Clunio marinus]
MKIFKNFIVSIYIISLSRKDSHSGFGAKSLLGGLLGVSAGGGAIARKYNYKSNVYNDDEPNDGRFPEISEQILESGEIFAEVGGFLGLGDNQVLLGYAGSEGLLKDNEVILNGVVLATVLNEQVFDTILAPRFQEVSNFETRMNIDEQQFSQFLKSILICSGNGANINEKDIIKFINSMFESTSNSRTAANVNANLANSETGANINEQAIIQFFNSLYGSTSNSGTAANVNANLAYSGTGANVNKKQINQSFNSNSGSTINSGSGVNFNGNVNSGVAYDVLIMDFVTRLPAPLRRKLLNSVSLLEAVSTDSKPSLAELSSSSGKILYGEAGVDINDGWNSKRNAGISGLSNFVQVFKRLKPKQCTTSNNNKNPLATPLENVSK